MYLRLVRIVNQSERRKDRRVQLRRSATVGSIPGRITDLSLSGCGFFTDGGALTIGDRVNISLIDETSAVMTEIPAKVVASDKSGLIYGLSFCELPPGAYECLEKIMVAQTLGNSRPAPPVLH